MASPRNDIERAAARCDIDQLAREIRKRKNPDFHISDYVRKDVITSLMREEIKRASLLRETRVRGMVKMLDFLVSEGLDFSAESLSKHGVTCLMLTATWNAELCRTLIRHGANVNAVDRDGRTALFYAVESNDPQTIIGLLLNSGIDYTVKFPDILLNTEQESVLDLLIDRCINHESEAETGKIILSIIARFKNERILGIVQSLMSKIEYSIQQQIKVFEYLGCLCLKPGFPDTSKTLAYWKKAVELGNEHGIAGEGLQFYDDPSGLGAAFTAGRGHLLYLYILIIETHHGDDNRAFIINGIRLLLWEFSWEPEIFHEIVRVIQFLINNHDICKTRDAATLTGDVEIIEAVNVMHKAIRLFAKLFDGAKQMPSDAERNVVVEQLVRNFMRLNLVNSWNLGPLHFAVMISRPVTKMMLECGANFRARNSMGENPFQVFLRGSSQSLFCETLDCFIEHGAHIDEKMPDGTRFHEFLRRNGFMGLREGKYVTLKCLAARVITDHGISYEGEVPETLKNFIRIHQ